MSNLKFFSIGACIDLIHLQQQAPSDVTRSHTRVHIHHDDSVSDAILSSETGQARPLLSCYHSYGTANGKFGGEL